MHANLNKPRAKSIKPKRSYRKFFENLRSKGIGETLKLTSFWIYEHIYDAKYERKYQINTGGLIEGPELGYGYIDKQGYIASPYRILFRIFRHIEKTITGGTFIDYGSGMGRGVIVAATFPFQKVIGVELNHDLNDIARRNVSRAESKLYCKDIELVDADATTFSPPSQSTHFFFYNPFDNDILQKVSNKIQTSLLDNPRDIMIIYLTGHPEREIVWDSCEWLLKITETSFSWTTYRPFLRIYSNNSGCLNEHFSSSNNILLK